MLLIQLLCLMPSVIKDVALLKDKQPNNKVPNKMPLKGNSDKKNAS